MQIDLPPELEQIVRAYIHSGRYQTAVDVLQAGVQLLQREEMPNSITFGAIDERLQFTPLSETEMIRESLKVLENNRADTIPHSTVEAWVENLGNNARSTWRV
jgi:putative addiction module CopG family antidote